MPKKPQEAEVNSKSLWPEGSELKYIMITGERGTGKSMFPYGIDPRLGAMAIIDTQGGHTTYAAQMGARHFDMPQIMGEKYPNGYEAYQYFLEVRDIIANRIPSGEHTVLLIDDIAPVEEGAKDHVDKFPAEYKLTPGQITKSPALAWGKTKSALEQLLHTASAKVVTVCVVTDLKNVWQGNAPTSQKEPRGLETLTKLASLFLWFHRDQFAKIKVNGKMVPMCPYYPAPSAVITNNKCRLVQMAIVDGELEPSPVLPPRLPKATAAEIRKYIANPVNYKALRPEECTSEYIPGQDEDPLLLAERQAELDRQKVEQEAALGKARLVQQLHEIFPDVFTDGIITGNGGRAVGAIMRELGITYTVAAHGDILAAIQEKVNGRSTAA